MSKGKDLNIEYPAPPVSHTINISDNPDQKIGHGNWSPISSDCLGCCCDYMGLCLEIALCCLIC